MAFWVIALALVANPCTGMWLRQTREHVARAAGRDDVADELVSVRNDLNQLSNWIRDDGSWLEAIRHEMLLYREWLRIQLDEGRPLENKDLGRLERRFSGERVVILFEPGWKERCRVDLGNVIFVLPSHLDVEITQPAPPTGASSSSSSTDAPMPPTDAPTPSTDMTTLTTNRELYEGIYGPDNFRNECTYAGCPVHRLVHGRTHL